jgi:RNA polymerase sigma-70 factor, ECF subfamily
MSELTAERVSGANPPADLTASLEAFRTELTGYCYRMLGSAFEAEDAVQESFVRAWRAFDSFEGRSSLRSWLYRIATNVCLSMLGASQRRARPMDLTEAQTADTPLPTPLPEATWIEPMPDGRVVPDGDPEDVALARESVRLAFVAALQHLPPNQRATLILREVLGFSAEEVADALETSVAAVNSALQRARKTIDERLPDRSQQATLRALGDERLRAIVDGYMAAMERGDVDAVVAMLAADATWSMPPQPEWYRGHAAIVDFLRRAPLSGAHRWRHVPARANGQAAVGCYVWDADRRLYAPWVLDVLTLDGDRIAAVTAFIGAEVPPRFGLPEALPA